MNGRQLRTALAVALFVAVTGLRFAVDADAYDSITLLYAVPIAILALVHGPKGGLLGCGVAYGLFCTWTVVDDVDVTFVAYLTRAGAALVLAAVLGYLVDEQDRLGRTNTRWFDMSNDLLVEADLRGYFVRVNGQWERQLGWTAAELTSRPMLDFVHPDDRDATAVEGDRLDRSPGEVTNFENRYRAKDGSYRWLLWNSRSDGRRKYAVARDITDRKALEDERQVLLEQVQALSRTDSLTGLPNRRAWDEELAIALARARRHRHGLALAMIDLDRFKDYNDTHGHQAGDDLLMSVAGAWRHVLRETDFLARYGGEEFAVLLVEHASDEAIHLLDRIRLATPQDQTCSVGIAHWDGDEDATELLARADAALYEAKRVGRDRVVSSA